MRPSGYSVRAVYWCKIWGKVVNGDFCFSCFGKQPQEFRDIHRGQRAECVAKNRVRLFPQPDLSPEPREAHGC